MEDSRLQPISFRGVCPQDLSMLEKWYAMTDQFGYATGFKSFREVQEKILPFHCPTSMASMMIVHGSGRAAGFVSVELRDLEEKKVVWIHIIIVDPSFQNRGMGTQAVRQLLHCYAARGATTALVSVSRRNLRGLRFWEGLGFNHSSAMEHSLSASGTSGVAIMKKALTIL